MGTGDEGRWGETRIATTAAAMLGSGLNLVSAALGFGMTAAFVAFVCARFACCRARGDDSGPPPSLDFSADLDGAVRATPRSPSIAVDNCKYSSCRPYAE